MGWLNVVKTWLGQPAEAPVRAGPVPPVPVPQAPEVVATPPARPACLLRREEILDRAGRLAGYRFSVSGEVAPEDFLMALRQARVAALAERRLAWIVLAPEQWPQADWASVVGAHTVFQMAWPTSRDASSQVLAVARQVRAARAGLALALEGAADGVVTLPDTALALATHVITRLAAGSAQERVEQGWQAWRRVQPGLQVAVQDVGSWSERHLCMAMGAHLALGDFLGTVDTDDQAPRLNERRLVLMDMLQVLRHDGDVQALADVAKRDPGVAVHVLSMANAPVYGLQQTVTGLEQALVVLGRDTLYRWLTIALFKSGEDGARDAALLEVALARARFLELVGLVGGSKAQADELFLVGLLSFVDSLLGQPLAEVLGDMSLPDAVSQVLLHNEGPYSTHLLLALAVERAQAPRVLPLAERLGLSVALLAQHRSAALAWAEEAAR